MEQVIRIVIEGDESGAHSAFGALNADSEQSKAILKEFGEGLREGITKELEAAGIKGEELGKKTAAGAKTGGDGIKGLLVTLGAAKLAFDGILGVVNTIVNGFVKLITASIDWAETVDGIQDLTGVTAEYGAVIAHVAEIAGVSAESIAQGFAANARITEAAIEEQKKMAAEATAKKQEEADAEIALVAERNAKVAEINKAAAERTNELAEAQARVNEDYGRANLTRDTQLGAAKVEQTRKTNTELATLDKQHADALQATQDSIKRSEDEFNHQRENAARDLEQAKEAAEKRYAATVASINADIAKSDTDLARERKQADDTLKAALLDAEKQHALRIRDIDRTIANARRDDAEAELDRQDESARRMVDISERANDKLRDIATRNADAIQRINESIVDANEDFETRKEERAERTAERLEDFDKRAEDSRRALNERVLRSTDELERVGLQSELDIQDQKAEADRAQLEKEAAEAEAKEQAKQDKKLAKLQAQLDRENAAYAAQQAAIEAERAKAEADETARLARITAIAQRENAERLADLQLRITDENTRYAEQQVLLQQQSIDRLADLQRVHDEAIAELKARIETENIQLAEQTAVIQREYDEREAEAQRSHTAQIAALNARIVEENSAYAAQTTEIKTESDRRLAMLQANYDTDVANAKFAYDRKVADNAEAQKKIADDTAARIIKEDTDLAESVTKARTVLADFLADQQANLPPVLKAFKDLHLDFDTWMNSSPDKKTDMLVAAVGRLKDGTEKTALEMTLFGKSGKDLNDFFEVYLTKSLDEWKKQSEDLYGVTNEEGVQSAINIAREWRLVQAEISGMFIQISRDLLPAFKDLLGQFQLFRKEHGKEVVNFIKNSLVPAIKDILKAIQDVIAEADKFAKTPLGKQLLSGAPSGVAVAGAPISTTAGLPSGAFDAINQNGLDTRNRIIAAGGTNFADFIRILFGGNPVGTNGTGDGVISSTSPTQIAGGGLPPITIHNTTINVANPITDNASIPSMSSYLNMTYGSPQ